MQVVGPKRKSLEDAEHQLADQLANLERKQQELNAVREKLNGLQSNLVDKQDEKKVGRGRKPYTQKVENICSSETN